MVPTLNRADTGWAAFFAPYRLEAERLGFVFFMRHHVSNARSLYFEVAADSERCIFLEVSGDVHEDSGDVARSHISLVTYVETQYLLRWTTTGVPMPTKRISRLHVALQRWLTPAVLRSVPIRNHADLESLVAMHERSTLTLNGQVLAVGADPAEARRALEQRLEDEYDDDGMPRERAN